MGNEKAKHVTKNTIITLVRGSVARVDPPCPVQQANPEGSGRQRKQGKKAAGAWQLCGPGARPGVKAQCAAACGPKPSFAVSLLKRGSACVYVVSGLLGGAKEKLTKLASGYQSLPQTVMNSFVTQAFGVLAKNHCQIQGHEALPLCFLLRGL